MSTYDVIPGMTQVSVSDDSAVPLVLLEYKNPDYYLYSEDWETITDLKEGAYAMKRNIRKYCPMRTPDEDRDIYEMRLKKFSYTPVMSNAIREFVSKLVTAPIHLTGIDNQDFWDKFRKNTNGLNNSQRRDEQALLTEIFSTMLYYGRVYVAVDTPKLAVAPRSAYEAKVMGNMPYVIVYDPRHVINWGLDWFVTKQFYLDSKPLQVPRTVCRWSVWDAERVRVYEIECYRNIVNPWAIDQIRVGGNWVMATNGALAQVPKVDEWVHGLGRCPISMLQLPTELWTGNNVYLKQLQHTMIESGWTEAGAVAGTIQRIFTPPDAPPIDDPRSVYEQPDYAQELSKIGNQYVLIGKDYRVVESSGAAIGSLTDQLNVIEQQIKDLVSMRFASVDPSKGATEQSGSSKQVDMSLLEDAMKAYGSRVIMLYNDILSTVARMAGEPEPTATGLNSYSTDNLSEMCTDSQALSQLPLPPTAVKLWIGKLSNLMVGSVSPDDEEQIQVELEQMFLSGVFDPQQPTTEDPGATAANDPNQTYSAMKDGTAQSAALQKAFKLSPDDAAYVLGGKK